jgi:3-methyladenine DNA glycosylase AlkD
MRYYGKERKRRQHWHDVLYSCFGGVNNWDLVDTCAHKIFGQHAFNTGDFSTLEELLESSNVWKKRAAIVAQLWMLKQGRYDELLAYAPVAAEDAPEILQKAIGWLMKCLWQQQPELAEDHMAAYLQEGLYTRLIVRIGLEKAGKDHRNHFLATFAPK